VLARQGRELVVVNTFVLLPHAIVHDLEELAGEVGAVAVGQMAAMAQVHGEDLVAGFQEGEVHGHVRAGTGVRLDIDVLGAEELLRPVNGELLGLVHVLAAAVPALAG